MDIKEMSNEKAKNDNKTTEKHDINNQKENYHKKGKIIPTDEVMKKFYEIYEKHKVVFDYLKVK